MILSVSLGLVSYFTISSYAAPVISSLIGMVVIYVGTKIAPDNTFTWSSLNEKVTAAIEHK